MGIQIFMISRLDTIIKKLDDIKNIIAKNNTSKKTRYVLYENQKCELLGMTDATALFDMSGLAFTIVLPDGTVRNVKDIECKFLMDN